MSIYSNCNSCDGSNYYPLKNTWTSQKWIPQYISPSTIPVPCGVPSELARTKNTKEHFQNKNDNNHNTITNFLNETTNCINKYGSESTLYNETNCLNNALQKTLNNSNSNKTTEFYIDTHYYLCNSSQFLPINKTWTRQKLFTT
jgi:hypothetical protein